MTKSVTSGFFFFFFFFHAALLLLLLLSLSYQLAHYRHQLVWSVDQYFPYSFTYINCLWHRIHPLNPQTHKLLSSLHNDFNFLSFVFNLISTIDHICNENNKLNCQLWLDFDYLTILGLLQLIIYLSSPLSLYYLHCFCIA